MKVTLFGATCIVGQGVLRAEIHDQSNSAAP
jgi:hypothetical protein